MNDKQIIEEIIRNIAAYFSGALKSCNVSILNLKTRINGDSALV